MAVVVKGVLQKLVFPLVHMVQDHIAPGLGFQPFIVPSGISLGQVIEDGLQHIGYGLAFVRREHLELSGFLTQKAKVFNVLVHLFQLLNEKRVNLPQQHLTADQAAHALLLHDDGHCPHD